MTGADTTVRTAHQPARLDGLVEALDRLVDTGAAVLGDVVISVGGVDLVRVDVRALVAAVHTEAAR
jgi:hypothetical protein